MRTPQKQKVEEVIQCLEDRYSRTRLEKTRGAGFGLYKIEKDHYEDEDNFLHAMEELEIMNKELKVIEEEWHTMWLLKMS